MPYSGYFPGLFELMLNIQILWYFVIQNTGVVILGSQSHGYRWSGSVHHQDISQNGIGPVSPALLPEMVRVKVYSAVQTGYVKTL